MYETQLVLIFDLHFFYYLILLFFFHLELWIVCAWLLYIKFLLKLVPTACFPPEYVFCDITY